MTWSTAGPRSWVSPRLLTPADQSQSAVEVALSSHDDGDDRGCAGSWRTTDGPCGPCGSSARRKGEADGTRVFVVGRERRRTIQLMDQLQHLGSSFLWAARRSANGKGSHRDATQRTGTMSRYQSRCQGISGVVARWLRVRIVQDFFDHLRSASPPTGTIGGFLTTAKTRKIAAETTARMLTTTKNQYPGRSESTTAPTTPITEAMSTTAASTAGLVEVGPSG